MKRIILVVLALTIAVTAFAGNGEIRRAADPIPNSYLVVLNKDIPRRDVQRHAEQLAKAAGGRAGAVLTHAIKGFAFYGPEYAARAIARNPNVAWVEEDGEMQLASCPIASGETYHVCDYGSSDDHWALDRIDQRWPIGSNKKFAYTYTGNGVRAYVVDTGVRGSHDEFKDGSASRVTTGANMTVDPEIADPKQDSNEEDPIPLDYADANNPCDGNIDSGNWNAIHGTSVASVLGGNTVGVARGVTIVPVKVASCYDDGKQTKLSMLATARGLDWILQDYDDIRTNGYNPNYNPSQRAVVNISLRYRLSSHGSYTCEDDAGGYVNCLSAIEHEILTLIQNDIPVVVSAGNDGHDVSNDGMSRMGYGGSFSTHHTITVGGTEYSANGDERWVCNQGDFASPFSCTGNAGSNIGAAVSIWAPAWNVKAAGGFTEDDFRPGTNHGTSFAAPLVTGAIARILEKYPSKSAEDIWDYLWSSATGPAYIGDLDSSVTCPPNPHPETDKYCEERLLYISAYD